MFGTIKNHINHRIHYNSVKEQCLVLRLAAAAASQPNQHSGHRKWSTYPREIFDSTPETIKFKAMQHKARQGDLVSQPTLSDSSHRRSTTFYTRHSDAKKHFMFFAGFFISNEVELWPEWCMTPNSRARICLPSNWYEISWNTRQRALNTCNQYYKFKLRTKRKSTFQPFFISFFLFLCYFFIRCCSLLRCGGGERK